MTQPSTPPLAGEARDEVQEAAARLLADAESWEGVTSPAARNIAADIRTVLSALRSLPGAVTEQDFDGVALEVLCRVFDDGADDGVQEWLAFDKSGWLSSERALGAFIRGRLDSKRESAPLSVSDADVEKSVVAWAEAIKDTPYSDTIHRQILRRVPEDYASRHGAPSGYAEDLERVRACLLADQNSPTWEARYKKLLSTTFDESDLREVAERTADAADLFEERGTSNVIEQVVRDFLSERAK